MGRDHPVSCLLEVSDYLNSVVVVLCAGENAYKKRCYNISRTTAPPPTTDDDDVVLMTMQKRWGSAHSVANRLMIFLVGMNEKMVDRLSHWLQSGELQQPAAAHHRGSR